MADYLRDDLSVEDFAAFVGLSPSRLAHLFKSEVGGFRCRDPEQDARHEAASLLRHTDRSAADVALRVGFHHYRHFAQHYGAVDRLPTRWRQAGHFSQCKHDTYASTNSTSDTRKSV